MWTRNSPHLCPCICDIRFCLSYRCSFAPEQGLGSWFPCRIIGTREVFGTSYKVRRWTGHSQHIVLVLFHFPNGPFKIGWQLLCGGGMSSCASLLTACRTTYASYIHSACSFKAFMGIPKAEIIVLLPVAMTMIRSLHKPSKIRSIFQPIYHHQYH